MESKLLKKPTFIDHNIFDIDQYCKKMRIKIPNMYKSQMCINHKCVGDTLNCKCIQITKTKKVYIQLLHITNLKTQYIHSIDYKHTNCWSYNST